LYARYALWRRTAELDVKLADWDLLVRQLRNTADEELAEAMH